MYKLKFICSISKIQKVSIIFDGHNNCQTNSFSMNPHPK